MTVASISPVGLLWFILVGAGLIATWVDVRFPSLRPKRIAVAVRHVGVACGFTWIVPLVLGILVVRTGSPALEVAELLGLLLPSLVYAFLTGFWLFRLARGAGQPG